ncbi:ATP synthase subunit I [Rhodovulum marinum]|uniref:F1-F0 ATPase (N-ATPase) AtpR subunit n=1 Tax=Rhodovulum marinum TaxID=320662 RepID=A0A4R2Q0C9_9RHOB|nr:ATP synthase subunit I [Rhodovulum marinum]TCP39971.1 F1-F0 ATPase (N-ATPase) AtpR subunit [Rhodovulum marinum]
MSMALLVQAVAGLAGGLALGAVYFALLGRSVALAAPTGTRGRALIFFGLRLSLAAGALWLTAQASGLALIAMLAGFLLARGVVLRRVREG